MTTRERFPATTKFLAVYSTEALKALCSDIEDGGFNLDNKCHCLIGNLFVHLIGVEGQKGRLALRTLISDYPGTLYEFIKGQIRGAAEAEQEWIDPAAVDLKYSNEVAEKYILTLIKQELQDRNP
jgi:hypothetical protein